MTTTATVHTAKEVAEMLNVRLLPASAKPLTERSIARLCKLGKLPGAYMALGDWCIPVDGVEHFIEETRGNTNGRPRKMRNKKSAAK